jgi:hypothetical protein
MSWDQGRASRPGFCIKSVRPRSEQDDLSCDEQQGEAFIIAVRIVDAASGVLCVANTASKYPSITDGRFLLIDLTGGSSRNCSLKDEVVRMTNRRP